MSFVAFVPLDPDRPRPVERNERVELVSAKLVAEADAQEAKVRAEKLFDANSELTAELRRVRARADEFEARVKELLSQLELAKRAEGEALARAADIRAEAEKFGVVLGADTDAPAAGDGWPGTTAPGGMGG
jgi:predicted nuclease with TOPRIM domain